MARKAALRDRDVLPFMKLALGVIVPPVSHICTASSAAKSTPTQHGWRHVHVTPHGGQPPLRQVAFPMHLDMPSLRSSPTAGCNADMSLRLVCAIMVTNAHHDRLLASALLLQLRLKLWVGLDRLDTVEAVRDGTQQRERRGIL